MKLASIAMAIAAFSVSGAAFAVDYTYTGSLTAGSPTYNRTNTLTALEEAATV